MQNGNEQKEKDPKNNFVEIAKFVVGAGLIYWGINHSISGSSTTRHTNPIPSVNAYANVGMRLWKEVNSNCTAYAGKKYTTLMGLSSVEQDKMFLHCAEGDSCALLLHPVSEYAESARYFFYYFPENILRQAGLFEHGQGVITTWATWVEADKCHYMITDIRPPNDHDFIEYGNRRVTLLQQQDKTYRKPSSEK